jgi:hypothetical protein
LQTSGCTNKFSIRSVRNPNSTLLFPLPCVFVWYLILDFIVRAVIAQSVQHWDTGWMIRVLGFDSQQGLGIFLVTTASRTALGPTQPPIQWVPGVLSLGVKQPGMKLTTHLHQCWGQRMSGAIPPLLQYAFMAWCSVKSTGTTFCLSSILSYWWWMKNVL